MRYAPYDILLWKEKKFSINPSLDDSTELFAFDLFFSSYSFTGLVAYRTAGLTSGLTGASAFAAARYFLFLGFCNRFNHNRSSPKYDFIAFIIIYFLSNCKYFVKKLQ